MVLNFHSFCLSAKLLISPSYLNEILAGYSNLGFTKMGTIKDRNCMDLTEAEDIKKRWQENTEELYKKDLHDPDNHDGVPAPTLPRHPDRGHSCLRVSKPSSRGLLACPVGASRQHRGASLANPGGKSFLP